MFLTFPEECPAFACSEPSDISDSAGIWDDDMRYHRGISNTGGRDCSEMWSARDGATKPYMDVFTGVFW